MSNHPLGSVIEDPYKPNAPVPAVDATELRLALSQALEAMHGVVALILTDPYRSGLGYHLLTEHADKLVAAIGRGKRALKP
jgi:hypothetical protein